MITFDRLTKRYGTATAVEGLTAALDAAAITGFLGRNGAGKTTTIRMLLGLLEPSSGSALIDGRRYRELRWPLREVGAVLDGTSAHPHRRVRAHLQALAVSSAVPAKDVDVMLERVGLGSAADEPAGHLSLGMTQRLKLAAALLPDPAVLVLDEPFTGLDPDGLCWLRDLLRTLAADGRTVLVSSHLLADLQNTADRVLVLDRGRLVAHDSLTGFLDHHSGSAVRVRASGEHQVRLCAALRARGFQVRVGEDGALQVEGGDAADIGQVALDAGVPLIELVTQTATLQAAFFGASSPGGDG